MKKQIDVFDKLNTGCFIGNGKLETNKFPFNLTEIRKYLKKTGKTLEELTFREVSNFRV